MDELLKRSVRELRAPVPVRAVWRDALLAEITAQPQPRLHATWVASASRGWTARPWVALTAAVAILTLGLTGGLYLGRAWNPAAASMPNARSGLTTVRFVIVAPAARQVSLVGDFNGWNVSANPMRVSRDGQSWVLELPLSAGRHTYAFVVDGDVLRDPAAPSVVDDDFGVRNSVIFVADGRT